MPRNMIAFCGCRFDVDVRRTVPRVRVWGDASPDAILAALPDGWTIRNEDWDTSVQTDCGATAYLITRKAA